MSYMYSLYFRTGTRAIPSIFVLHLPAVSDLMRIDIADTMHLANSWYHKIHDSRYTILLIWFNHETTEYCSVHYGGMRG